MFPSTRWQRHRYMSLALWLSGSLSPSSRSSCSSILLSRIPQVQFQPDGSIAKTCTASKRTCAPACLHIPSHIHTYIFPYPIPIPDLQTRNLLRLAATQTLASTAKRKKCRPHWAVRKQSSTRAEPKHGCSAVQCRVVQCYPAHSDLPRSTDNYRL